MTPPVFAHGHLRLYLLSLLAESGRGMHGYELIQALGDRFGGTYVPSAGTIYPRLAKLEEEGLVTKVADGRKTVYEITDAGRAELAARQSELDGIENDLTDSVRRLADEVRSSVNDAMRSLRAELAAAAREARTEARSEGRSQKAEQTPDHVQSRIQLQQAESLLAAFRADVRTELRMRAARADLPAEVVERLRSGLDALRKQL
ncbi:PadR family transcriptional regulator [Salinibacterium soli]|uniref:PadR family transcriptional regulator n=1 Tax=Antiquaquibacter soli TaxID=3064523 RepID=A0ABT9BPL4_9MICO|nr:PadR family transcriptional regulator [Protaetiibacter sp. WY-16]MDO7882976.1 PadR family transcriptional regulator [Protaetiibacter sp. WY-16]